MWRMQRYIQNKFLFCRPQHDAADGSLKTLTESLPSITSAGGGSTINFDKITDIYQSLRQTPGGVNDETVF